MSKKKIIIGVLVILFIIIQLIPIHLPEVNEDTSHDLLVTEQAPEPVQSIIKTSCYDCHSNQTVYPWYSYVAPVSWLVAHDTDEGREELNLSAWDQLSKRKKIKVLNEIGEEVEKGDMPLKIYTLIHGNAKLSEEQVKVITSWTKSVSEDILNGKRD